MDQRTAWAVGFSDAYHQSQVLDSASIDPSIAISYQWGREAGARARAIKAAYNDLSP